MNASAMDWPTTVNAFADRFDGHKVRTKPAGLVGQNIMTPEWLGYVADRDGNPVEITTGIGFDGDRIFGCCWARLADGMPDGRDRCCHSLDEVADLLGV